MNGREWSVRAGRSPGPLQRSRPFLVLWSLTVTACVASFVLHLGLRSRTFQLGYEMGHARSEQARLREAKRVLELEVASFQNPQRVGVIAKTLLGMYPPTPDRIIPMSAVLDPDVIDPDKRKKKTNEPLPDGARAQR